MIEKHSLFNASFILAYRGNSADREENLHALLQHINLTYTDYTVWLIEADTTPKFDWKRFSNNNIRHVFIPNSGPFPKAMLYNTGAKLAQSQILIFNDVDCITEPKTLSDCVRELIHFQAHDVLCPFWEMINVSGETKKRFLAEPLYDQFRGINKDALTPDTSILYERNAGGIFLFRRTDFVRVGGMDPRFLGWGGEDNDLFYRATRLGIRWASLHTPLYHLHHDSPNRDGWREQAKDNSALGQESEHMPIEMLQHKAAELSLFFTS